MSPIVGFIAALHFTNRHRLFGIGPFTANINGFPSLVLVPPVAAIHKNLRQTALSKKGACLLELLAEGKAGARI